MMLNFKHLIKAFPDVFEKYMNNKWERKAIFYRTITGGELVDVRTTLTDTCMEIIELGDNIGDGSNSHDEVALECLRVVMRKVVYKRDIDRNMKPEFWQAPPVTFADGEGDCEDGALLLMSLMDAAGIPAWRRKICAGWVLDPRTKKKGGHAYVIYMKDDLNWYVLDWCYYAIDSIENYKKGVPQRNLNKYYDIWWTFNQQYSWAQHDTIIEVEKMVKKKTDVGESKKFKLNKEDGKKILKGLGVAVGGTVAMFALDMLPRIEWGQYTYVVIPLASVALNTLLKVFRGK